MVRSGREVKLRERRDEGDGWHVITMFQGSSGARDGPHLFWCVVGKPQTVTLSLRFSAPKKPRFNITDLSSIRLDAVREVSKAMGFQFRKRLRIFPGQNPKDHERDKDQVSDGSDGTAPV